MRSPNRQFSFEAEELRGAAALLVFFYHSIHTGASTVAGSTGWLTGSNPFSAFVFEGHTGVALFMVLSGYILASGTFYDSIRYSGFLLNRVLRIFPLMIVVVTFSMYTTQEANLGNLLAPFFLLANLPLATQSPSALSGTVWTISVEFQFYLIAPFLFLFVRRYGLLGFLLPAMLLFWILKVIVLLPIAPEMQYAANYKTIVGRIDQFMFGIGLAYLIDTGRCRIENNRATGAILTLVSATTILALTWMLNRQGGISSWKTWHLIYPEIEGFLWSMFIAGYLALKPFRGTPITTLLQWIGKLSFSIYILHYSIQREWWIAFRYNVFGEIRTDMLGVFLISCGILACVLFISMLSYKCIERPFLTMRVKYLSNHLDDKNNDKEALTAQHASTAI